MNFTMKHWNRINFPRKRILVVEDDLTQQVRLGNYLASLFGGQSEVIVTFCPTAIDAYAYIEGMTGRGGPGSHPRLIILDHDLQWGNGCELLDAIRELDPNWTPKVITASGIPQNNERLMGHGAHAEFTKDEIVNGKATELILEIMGEVAK